VELAMSEYENSISQPENALLHIEKLANYMGRKTRVYYLEKAKSLYLLGMYNEAKKQIDLVEYPDKILDRIDFLYMWSGKIYEGLIENKLGNSQMAIDLINFGIEKMESLTSSKYHVFAYKSLSEVYSSLGNYEKAFTFLKKSNEIQMRLSF
jgi:tetratricopeptide (TPR) repeat protein